MLLLATLTLVGSFAACAAPQGDSARDEPASSAESSPVLSEEEREGAQDADTAGSGDREGERPSSAASGESASGELAYPTGWLAVPEGGVPAGAPVQILELPDMSIVAHSGGKPVGGRSDAGARNDGGQLPDGDAAAATDGSAEGDGGSTAEADDASSDVATSADAEGVDGASADDGAQADGVSDGTAVDAVDATTTDASPDPSRMATISYQGETIAVDPSTLLVNLPDILPEADYDIVYSYASTSACAGRAIPGITGKRLQGYADGGQENAYWADRRFVVPCAYGTAMKLAAVASALREDGYRLLVYDAYRPMSAQLQLSEAFAEAYSQDPGIQEGIGGWGLEWYVASGSSGHNYGTDIDVGLADASGFPIAMPSAFDAFDESGHLTESPMAAASITPDAYRGEVRQNEACMALHRAFTDAGFAEVASEWWHFADEETEAAMRGIVGDGGLDFEALT